MTDSMKVVLANPRGFCAGVDRAIGIVERALEKYGAPVYVRHQVVHNKYVVNSLLAKGAVFVDELSEVPKGATVIFSAHGVSKAIREEARKLGLNVYDAAAGQHVILIGHAGHPEVEGTLGQVKQGVTLVESVADVDQLELDVNTPLSYVSQTTLSVDDTREIISELAARFPNVTGPKRDDICYATQNRQDAVKRLATDCDLVLVVGSTNSSNSNRLRELAEQKGVSAYLVDGADQIQPEWITAAKVIGVTAGASAPEVLVSQLIERLESLGAVTINMDAPEEGVSFSLPQRLL